MAEYHLGTWKTDEAASRTHFENQVTTVKKQLFHEHTLREFRACLF